MNIWKLFCKIIPYKLTATPISWDKHRRKQIFTLPLDNMFFSSEKGRNYLAVRNINNHPNAIGFGKCVLDSVICPAGAKGQLVSVRDEMRWGGLLVPDQGGEASSEGGEELRNILRRWNHNTPWSGGNVFIRVIM